MDVLKKVKAYLIKEVGLGEDEVDALLQMARESLIENLEKLEQYLKEENFEEFAKVAHTIKGVLLNLGLEKEAAISKKLELKAREERNKEELVNMLSTFKQNLSDLLK